MDNFNLTDEAIREAKHFLMIRKSCQDQIKYTEIVLKSISKKYGLIIDLENNTVVKSKR